MYLLEFRRSRTVSTLQ